MDKRSGPESAAQPPKREAFVVAKNQTASLTIAELQKRCDALTRENETMRRERDELDGNFSGKVAISPNAATQLEEAQRAIVSIRQARDSVLAQNQVLMAQLAAVKEQLTDLGLEKEDLESSRDTAVERAETSSREREDLRRQVLQLQDARPRSPGEDGGNGMLAAATQEQVAALLAERDCARAALEDVRAELQTQRNQPPAADRALTELQDARHRLADLEAQTEGFRAQQKRNIASLTKHLEAKGEAMRIQFHEEKKALEGQLGALQAQLANSGSASGAQRFGEQQLEMIELSEQLEAARTEIGELRAALDGLRDSSGGASEFLTTASLAPHPLPDAAPVAVVNYDASITLGAMSSCLEMLHQHPTSGELLEELDNHLETFSSRAQAAGLAALYRYSSACGELTRRLRKQPAKNNSTTLQPLAAAVELLTVLTGIRNVGRIPDPADALVYAVDDDPDNCECISMAFEKMSLRTKYSVRPEVALTELSAHPCDLIILDVDMPRMDGFELSSRLRKVAHHASTPIIFVSALTSTQDRLKENPSVADAFIAKPYNLNELGLRALGLILKTQAGKLQK